MPLFGVSVLTGRHDHLNRHVRHRASRVQLHARRWDSKPMDLPAGADEM
jgi:hypothetical protein